MYEVKHDIVKILLKTKLRNDIYFSFEEKTSAEQARKNYDTLLKQSARLYNIIERLRNDNPMLNRPFIYGKHNL